MKSLLIKDTTVDERMQIVKEALGGFGNCDCEGIDMDDMYDDYIFGRPRKTIGMCHALIFKTTTITQRTIRKWN